MKAKILCVKYMGSKAKALELQRLKDYVKTHRKVLLTKSSRDLKEIYEQKLCSSRQDYDDVHHNKYSPCPYVDTCFKKEKMLDRVAKVLTENIYPIIEAAPQTIRKELDL
jgi:hypothetical protein